MLHDRAIFHQADMIEAWQEVQAVNRDDHRFVRHRGEKSAEDDRFGRNVNMTGRLVEEKKS
ncbi:MAG: hypothetical protein WDO70_09415 [Alphaproteobacteria bacterium]